MSRRSKASTGLLASPKVQEAWSQANRVAHETIVSILKDETREGVSTTGGKVTLQLGTLVKELGTQIGLPTAVLDRIPADAGTIVHRRLGASWRTPNKR